MPEADRLDLIAIVILRGVFGDKAQYLALAKLAAEAGVDPREYIAKWVWAEARKFESFRP